MTKPQWLPEGWNVSAPRMLLATLICSVLVALVVFATVSTTAFGLYNPTWEGTSDLREEISTERELDLLTDTAEYGSLVSDEAVAFIIAPDEEYDDEAAEQVRRFVERGGTAVVFENFETNGNALLSDLGAEARFDGRVLRDEEHYFRGPEMPVATTVENHTLTEGVDQLTLNLGTAIEPGNATVLVGTSEFAYLVEEPDTELDDEDELATYPVATVEPLGEGQVVAVGDPSITINAMVDESDNAVFLERLSQNSDRVVFDLSHQESVPPLTSAVLAVRETPLLQVLLGGVAIVAVAGVSRGRFRRTRKRLASTAVWGRLRRRAGLRTAPSGQVMTAEQRVRYLRREHPDWDDDRIERVVIAFNRTSEEEGKRE
ncbi:DUF4350 domain-containing protein [Halovenus salina]|uniref:DUF4350 domain-containing protein n=1 Tax=Halovenus salina TaxID=1510225 RepID=A0ABD5W065_9EURY|nr:DUF4350 domain-containing protein [Halovenus salina]